MPAPPAARGARQCGGVRTMLTQRARGDRVRQARRGCHSARVCPGASCIVQHISQPSENLLCTMDGQLRSPVAHTTLDRRLRCHSYGQPT
jgi:hypothetical protein